MGLAPIALFCYNRLDLLRQTVDALGANKPAVSSNLFIFSDGPKNQDDIAAVNAIREYIRTISGFRSVTIREAETNQGLANSIIAGVTEVVNKYGRIIVLEDDIVTAPYFLQWMNDALNLYENEEKVAGIHAWSPPEQFGKRPETYFIREVGCWGWATWKRGWDLFEKDGEKLLMQFTSDKMIYDFNVYDSYPYYQMLKDQVVGNVDSWAIRWYASVFLNEKLGLQPGKTIVANIGYHSGTHFDGKGPIFEDRIDNTAPIIGMSPLKSADDVLRKVYFKYNRFYFPQNWKNILKKVVEKILSFWLGKYSAGYFAARRH